MADAAQDVWEIEQAHYRYARAHDRRDYAMLHTVFAPDGVIEYDPTAPLIGAQAVIDNNRRHLDPCGPTQHLMGNVAVEVSGDTAKSLCYVRAFHRGAGAKAALTYEVLGDYEAEWRRTPDGWRATRWLLHAWAQLGDPSVIAPV